MFNYFKQLRAKRKEKELKEHVEAMLNVFSFIKPY